MLNFRAGLGFILILCVGACSDPEAVDYLSKAQTHVDAGEWRAASIEARNAISGNPENDEARLILGQVLLLLGDNGSAQKELERARELGSPDALAIPPLALALLKLGRFEDAVALSADTVLDANAKGKLLATQAVAQFQLGRPDDAADLRDKAVGLAGDEPAVVLVDARLLLQSGRTNEAINRLQGLLTSLETRGDFDDGLTGFGPYTAEAHELLGDFFTAAGRIVDADQQYGLALETATVDVPIWLKRIYLKITTGDSENALIDIEALEQRGVTVPQLRYYRARAEMASGELLSAQTRLEQVLQEVPEEPSSLAALVAIHLALGNKGLADQYAKQVANLSENLASDALLGIVRLDRRDYSGAIDALEPLARYGTPDELAVRALTTALLAENSPVLATQILLSRTLQPGSADESVLPSMLVAPAALELMSVFNAEPVDVDFDATASIGFDAAIAQAETSGGVLDAKQVSHGFAIGLLVNNQTAVAQDLLDETLEFYPDDVPTLLLNSLAAAFSDDLGAAGTLATTAHELEPDNKETTFMLARIALAQGDHQAARQLVQRTSDTRDWSINDWVLAYQAAYAAGDLGAAEVTLNRAVEQFPRAIEAVIPLAVSLLAQEKYAAALQTLARLPAEVGQRTDIRGVRAVANSALDQHDEALEDLNAILEVNPNNASMLYLRSRSRGSFNDIAGMREDLDKAIAADPELVQALDAAARLALATNRPSEAWSFRDQLATLLGSQDPKVVALDRKALETRLSDATTTSGNGVSKQVEIENSAQLIESAKSLWVSNQKDAAIDIMDTWLDTNPEDIAVWLTLANAHLELDNNSDALAAYERTLSIDPENLVAMNNAAWILKESSPERAFDLATQAAESSPDNAAALDTLGVIAMMTGRNEIAVEASDKAMKLAPDFPEILFNAAVVSVNTGSTEIARERLQILLASDADFPQREEANDLLLSLD